MELVLILVALLACTVALVFLSNNHQRRQNLTFVEPLGSLVTRFEVVRHELLNSGLLEEILRHLEAAYQESHLAFFFRPSRSLPRTEISLEGVTELGPLLWQITIKEHQKRYSYYVGQASAVASVTKQGIVLKRTLDSTESQAQNHGYLLFGVARSLVHGENIRRTPKKYQFLGTVTLEPSLDSIAFKNLSNLEDRMIFLSVLPSVFLRYLAEKMRPDKTWTSVNFATFERLEPRFQEKELEKIEIIGNVSLVGKQHLTRFFDRTYRYRFLNRYDSRVELNAGLVDMVG